MPLQLSGKLITPLGSPAANALIRFTAASSTGNANGEVIQGAAQVARCAVDGSYTIELEYGYYELSTRISTPDYVVHGKVNVDADTTATDIEDLIAMIGIEPVLTDSLIAQFVKLKGEAEAAAASASQDAAQVSTDAAQVASQSKQVSIDAAQVASDKASVDTSEQNVNAKSAQVSTDAAQVSSDAATVASNTQTAVQSATDAKSWAVGPSGTGSGSDTNNAKYWAQQAEEKANQIFVNGGPFTPAAGIEYPDVSAVTKDTAYPVNLPHDSSYVFTGGQLAGKTALPGDMMMYDTPQNLWSLIESGTQGALTEASADSLYRRIDTDVPSDDVSYGSVSLKDELDNIAESLDRKNVVRTIQDLSSIDMIVGDRVIVSGFFSENDFNGHPGFAVKSGVVNEIVGRLYNISGGNHVEIDCEDSYINANWIGVNKGRSGFQNSLQISSYLSSIEAEGWHTIFVTDDIEVNELSITRNKVAIKTNTMSKLTSTSANAFKPHGNDFLLSGFRVKDQTFRISYVDGNQSQVINHRYENIKLNQESVSTRTPFLYSTAQGGAGWSNIEYYRVIGFAKNGTSVPMINHDHGLTDGKCEKTFIDKCYSDTYSELYSSTGSGFATICEITRSKSKNASGHGLYTYHTRGGLVIRSNEVYKHAKSAFMWVGVDPLNVTDSAAVVESNYFDQCQDVSTNPFTGLPIGHGAVFYQLNRGRLSGNFYRKNKGAGYVISGASNAENIIGETSTQNKWGCIVCSDASKQKEPVYFVKLANCNHWGNLEESILIGGAVERIEIEGGSHTQNNTSNSSLDTGQACITYSDTHSEAIDVSYKEANPLLRMMSINTSGLGERFVGIKQIDSYPEHSVKVTCNNQCTIFVTLAEVKSKKSEFNLSAGSGSRLILRSLIKSSIDSIPLIGDSTGFDNIIKSECYKIDGGILI